MNLACPKCNGEDTQLLPVVFASGVSVVTPETPEAAVASSGSAQTSFPIRTAPPKKASYLGVLMGWMIIATVLSLILTMFHLPLLLTNTFGFCLFCATGYSLTKAVAYNTREWPGLFQQWQRSYICMRCGNIFIRKLYQC